MSTLLHIVISPSSWLAAITFFMFCFSQGAADAGERSEPVQLQQEYYEDDVEGEGEAEEPSQWGTLGISVEGNIEHVDPKDTEEGGGSSDTDIYLGTVELDLRVFPFYWLETEVIVNVEDIGKEGETVRQNMDEAFATAHVPRGWYVVAGKTTLPFGVFEDHLISGTLIEDLYEIIEKGLSVGLAPEDSAVSLSLSYYAGQVVMEKVVDLAQYDFPDQDGEDSSGAYILRLGYEHPEESFSINWFYNNEPGSGRRNQTIGCALSLPVQEELTVDAEYVAALTRERDADGKENKEIAWVIGLSYQLVEPFELAVRYESFDDDRSGEQDEVLDYRYLAGFNYSLCEWGMLSVEYRHSELEKEPDSTAASNLDEVNIQLTLEYEWSL